MRWTILVFAQAFLATVQCQLWTGTYTVDSSCSTATCCCVSNTIVITRPATNSLAVNTSLSGVCFGETYFFSTQAYPTGYTASMTLSVFTITVTLSSNSSALTITNSFSSTCNGKAVRQMTNVDTSTTGPTITSITGSSSGVRQYIDIIMLFSLLFLSYTINM